jgi:DNA-binding XRE family transcriptional regulator
MSARVQIIEKDGKPEYAVVPIELYRQLLTLAEDAEDIRAANVARREIDAGEDETIPAAVARRLLDGTEHPLRIWREHRGLTQEALAAQAGVGKSYLSQIEAGKKTGSARILRTLAQILRVDMDDLLMPPAQE